MLQKTSSYGDTQQTDITHTIQILLKTTAKKNILKTQVIMQILYDCHRFIVLGTNPDAAARWLKQNHLGYVRTRSIACLDNTNTYFLYSLHKKKMVVSRYCDPRSALSITIPIYTCT